MNELLEALFAVLLLGIFIAGVAGITVFVFDKFHIPTGYRNCEPVYTYE